MDLRTSYPSLAQVLDTSGKDVGREYGVTKMYAQCLNFATLFLSLGWSLSLLFAQDAAS